ncbi:hypothetical protein SAMN00777080_1949 [Aquiflexum balticum DSM 16537]|jgi:hypothetical protein|uniref:Outer membrane protein beta-barrel domain-containing protein n=1 Tax=Aquiflexum balticum DSM 16537 TaxID=758820 RepID=A0A1W2H332_9BACT|nr:hypothetical protein [Aquiflexum balticum]SMD43357.1 hypothetical protein SAMN00777080_1949 [Aquiflexum balticum DSM 16537]
MKRYLTLILAILSFDTIGQDFFFNKAKFEITIGGGILLPVGSYANNSTTYFAQNVQSALIDTEFYYVETIFAKKRNASARRGTDLNLEINFLHNQRLVHGISLGSSRNAADLTKANAYFANLQFPYIVSSQEDYRVRYLAYSLGYRLIIKQIQIRPYQKIGIAQMNFPYYQLESTGFQSPWSFIHEGNKPKLSSLYLESGFLTIISLSSRVNLGLNLSYRWADFDYTMYKRAVPGGSVPVIVPDQVNLRAIQTGIRLGYTFSRE